MLFGLFLARSVEAAPRMAFEPDPLSFARMAVGQSQSQKIWITNAGDATLVVTGGGLAKGTGSAFRVAVRPFQLAPGGRVQLEIFFEPRTGGSHADVLSFYSNVLSADAAQQRPVLQLTGIADGPEIAVYPQVLGFASTGIGVAVSQKVLISNTGNDSLRLTQIKTATARFTAQVTAFVLPPDSSRLVGVTYVPDSSRARVDTLTIVSNDFDEGIFKVVLDAQETPLRVGVVRLGLSRVDTLKFPGVGDTLLVELKLIPNGASVAGVEVFFGYDPALFRPAYAPAPFVRAGYSLTRFQVRTNVVAGHSGTVQVVHLSALVKTSHDSIPASGLLAYIPMVVQTPITKSARLRVMVEAPLYNSQYITPAGLSFTAPGNESLSLGNTPPIIRVFPPLKMQEDVPTNLGLATLASDAESSVNDLKWAFRDPENLISISVSIPDSAIGPVARFFPPLDGSGTFAVTAMVTDPAGAGDSSVVVVDVAPVNDPPRVPKAVVPADSAVNVITPVTFRWQGGDPDGKDAIKYDLHFGPNRLFLSVLAKNVSDTIYAHPSLLSPNTIYFWRVVTTDPAGLQTQSPIWLFQSRGDFTPPAFVVEPNLLEISDTTVAVFWNSDEPASARLVLGLKKTLSDSSLFDPIVPPGRIQLRNVQISGLRPGTVYFYQITMTDAAGNVTRSSILSFQTTGNPVVVPLTDLGDMNEDRKVNFADFTQFVSAYGYRSTESQYLAKADLNADGRVDFADFITFTSVYGIDYAATTG